MKLSVTQFSILGPLYLSEIKSNSKRDYLIIIDLCLISVQNELRQSINVSFLPLWLSSKKSYFEPWHRLTGVFSALINGNQPHNWTLSELILLLRWRNRLGICLLALLSNRSSWAHLSLPRPCVRLIYCCWAGHPMSLLKNYYSHKNGSQWDWQLNFNMQKKFLNRLSILIVCSIQMTLDQGYQHNTQTPEFSIEN